MCSQTDLMQTGVLDMVRSHCLLSFDLHTYVHPDSSRNSRLISSLICHIKIRYVCLLRWMKHVPSATLSLPSLSVSLTKTYPGCTTRPSPHSVCGLRWWFDPGNHHFHVWTSVSRETWCRRPHPTHGPWYGLMSCGIRWKRRRQKSITTLQRNNLWRLCSPPKSLETVFLLYSQVEALLPNRVQVAIDGLGSLFGFSNLNSDVRVTGACLVFSLKALSTNHWGRHRKTFTQRPCQLTGCLFK